MKALLFFIFLLFLSVSNSFGGGLQKLNDIKGITLKKQTPIFIEYKAPEMGVYSFHINSPGSIQLFAKEDVSNREKKRVTPLLKKGSALQNISLEKVFLTPKNSYVLGIVANQDSTLTVSKEKSVVKTGGDTLSLDQWLVVQADTKKKIKASVAQQQPVKIVVYQEPGEDVEVKVKNGRIPKSGLYPYVFGFKDKVYDKDNYIYVIPGYNKTARFPYVLIHMSKFNEDELLEPNSFDHGIKVELNHTIRGSLLSTDVDKINWDVVKTIPQNLKIESDTKSGSFSVKITKVEPKIERLLYRKSQKGLIEIPNLLLEPGTYEMSITREGQGDEGIRYSIAMSPYIDDGEIFDQEPNDFIAKKQFENDFVVKGNLNHSDKDVFTHIVPTNGELWRYVAIGDIDKFEVYDRSKRRLFSVEPGHTNVISEYLTLLRGAKTIILRGSGQYTLRAIALGAPTPGFEKESNNSIENAERLHLGTTKKGVLRTKADKDVYYLSLASSQPVRFTITPPDDGNLTAQLNYAHMGSGQGQVVGGTVTVGPEDEEPFSFSSNLPAGDYTLHIESPDNNSLGDYSIETTLNYKTIVQEPDDSRGLWRLFPPDSAARGVVDSFNFSNHYIIPVSPGTTILTACDSRKKMNWSLEKMGGDKDNILKNSSGLFIYENLTKKIEYLLLKNKSYSNNNYLCQSRVLPDLNVTPVSSVSEEKDFVLKLGEKFTTNKKGKIFIKLDIPDYKKGVLLCNSESNESLKLYNHDNSISNLSKSYKFAIINNNNKENIKITQGDKGIITCGLVDFNSLPSVSSSLADKMKEEVKRYSGFIIDDSMHSQIFQPIPARLLLDVSVELQQNQIRAYAKAGQRIKGNLTIGNRGVERSITKIDSRLLADGWKLLDIPPAVTLDPGEKKEISFEIIIPPFVAENNHPALEFAFQQGWKQMKKIVPLKINQQVKDVEFINYWSIPEELRGSINVLWDSLGSRLIEIDGKPADERKVERSRFLHDGIALHHFDQAAAPGKELVFNIGLPAPVAGAMFHLLSSRERATWPDNYSIELKDEVGRWHKVATGSLDASSQPQYIIFDRVVTACQAKLIIHDCHLNPKCTWGPSIEEFQLLADRDWRPKERFNLADPDFGAHVVFSKPSFSTNWNDVFLNCKNNPRACSGHQLDEGNENITVLSFNRDRTALIDEIRWKNNKHEQRQLETYVYVSKETPFGPWEKIGKLQSENTNTRVLKLDKSVWTKYIKFVTPVQKTPQIFYPPASLEIFEAKEFHSILGSWEESNSRAVYEDISDISTMEVITIAGGASKEESVVIPLNEKIESSVKLERNADWYSFTVPGDKAMDVTLSFHETIRPEQSFNLEDSTGKLIELHQKKRKNQQAQYGATVPPGNYFLKVYEPPRSIVITWDTSNSVREFIPYTINAVRKWAKSLQPGRDMLQLLPFGAASPILSNWAGSLDDVLPYIDTIEPTSSSEAEKTMFTAVKMLQNRPGVAGIVVITDNESKYDPGFWELAEKVKPRIVALSIINYKKLFTNAMRSWGKINNGVMRIVEGRWHLDDGFELASAIFRASKPYKFSVTLTPVERKKLLASIELKVIENADLRSSVAVILDGSGSMLKRMANGKRRITIAKSALLNVTRYGIKDSTKLSLRVFGIKKDSCQTIKLINQQPLNKNLLKNTIDDIHIENYAKTAIGTALSAVSDDFTYDDMLKNVILVTDGEETCGGDVPAEIRKLVNAGINVNIIGFAIDDTQLKSEMRSWALLGNGSYFDVSSLSDFTQALRRGAKPSFIIKRKSQIAGESEEIFILRNDESITIPAGMISVMNSTGEKELMEFQLQPGEKRTLVYDNKLR